MRVKLLKKLHKRFTWRYEPAGIWEWKLFDKKENCEISELPQKGFYETERLILKMMQILHLEQYWRSRYDKFEAMRIEKLHRLTSHKFRGEEPSEE